MSEVKREKSTGRHVLDVCLASVALAFLGAAASLLAGICLFIIVGFLGGPLWLLLWMTS